MVGTAEDVCRRLCHLGEAGVIAPRLLVVLAHPDDEVLALGGRMEWLGTSTFVSVTDGVPLDGRDAHAHGFAGLLEYGRARRQELERAMRLAGLNPATAMEMRLSDGSTISDQRATFSLGALAQAIAVLLAQFKPDAVLTHPYEGGHPDHDACAFVVNAAVRCAGLGTSVIEAPFYHAEPAGAGMRTGEFLDGAAGCAALLLPAQAQRKRDLLACFESQRDTLKAFGSQQERYRPAPVYDFLRRPHAGALHYERYAWGMDGDRFCALAGDALRELGC